MIAPRRLLSSDPGVEACDLTVKLLQSARDVGPPAGAKAAVWADLEATLGGPPPGGGGQSGPTGAGHGGAQAGAPAAITGAPVTGASVALVAKLGIVACAAVGLALILQSSAPDEQVAARHAAESAQVGAPPAALLAAVPSVRGDSPGSSPIASGERFVAAEREARAPSEPSPGDAAAAHRPARVLPPTDAPADSPVTVQEGPASLLKREAEGLRRARTELAAGNGRAALVVLGEIDRDVPRGVLGQERALVAIEALAKTGQSARAKQSAEAFLAAYPQSPHAERVRPFLGTREAE